MTALRDVVDLVYGCPFPSSGFRNGLDPNGLPVVRIRDVVPGFSNTSFVGRYDSNYIVEDGDMLIGMDGEFNLGRWRGGRALLNQRVCKVVPRIGKVEERYLFWALPRYLKAIEARTPFVTVKHLSAKALAAIELELPTLSEQRRIADILDKADAIRRKRKEAIALTEELLRSTFLEMFGDPVTNPKSWPVRTAADVCGSFGGALQTGPFGSQLHASDYTEEGVPVVMPQDLVDGGISTARVARVSAEHVARLERHKLELGDVVFSRRGDVARFAVVENHQVGWLCGTGCLRIRFAGAPLTAAFLRGELAHPSKREWLESEAKGTTMPNLNTSILGKLSIRMPPRGVQEAFEQIAQRVRAMRSKQLDSSTEADHLFNSLVARAFSGALSS